MYKANIEYIAYEDSYEHGELDQVNRWNEIIEADTQSELRNKILEATYSKWEDLDDEQMNEYDWCTEYHTSYLANEDNQGSASESEIEAWKRGELKLYAINCHICVTEVTEKKATL
jgi:hypothetical protein